MALFGELTYALISASGRSIGTIIPDVAIEEQHHDELVITEFPVEEGASITDHAYQRPAQILMRVGFSNSSAGSEGYVQQIYAEMLALQRSRRPFDVFTGKRRYKNMLIGSLDVVTDQHSENSLMVAVGMREIILTRTQSQSNGVGPKESQAMPQVTGSIDNAGTKQLVPFGEGTTLNSGMFTTAPGSLGLGPTDATANVDAIIVDGERYDTNFTDLAPSGVAPSTLPGNLGLFGSYAPGAFGRSPTAPF